MMSRWILQTIIVLITGYSAGARAEFSATCIGNPGTQRQIIFLRGITADLGTTEKWRLSRFRSWDHSVLSEGLFFEKLYYDADWEHLSQVFVLRIAIIESDRYCAGSLSAHCWTGDEPGSIASTYAEVVRTASRCFPVADGNFGLVGFSNGGYHVNRVIMQCLKPSPRWAIAVGSAGDINLAGDDLSSCTKRLTLATGDLDGSNSKARSLATDLRKRKLDVRFFEFIGGHEIPRAVLLELLGKQP